jgi:hypothetical protein
MATADGARGIQGNLEGETTLDVKAGAIEKFLAYGEAKAWGAGHYTPRPPKGEFPLKFAIVEVKDDASKSTPPQAAAYGDGEYKKPG